MDFKEQLEQLSLQVAERKNHITNEETTKQALIIPFIQLLGYDVFNPLEVRPEYSADFAKRKGARVDYAIFDSDDVLIFFETKPVTEKLEKYNSQLAYYFNATHQLKLAILSNGLDYYMFTDLNVANVMDDSPFFRFNILSITDDAVKVLDQIRKQNFNTKSIFNLAEELVYRKDLDNIITRILKNPSSDFIRFVLKDISNTRITTVVIDKFRPLVEKSILDAIESIYLENFNFEKSEEQELNEIQKGASTSKTKAKKPPEPTLENKDSTEQEVSGVEGTAASMDDPFGAQTNEEVKLVVEEIEPTENNLEVFQLVKKILELEGLDFSALAYSAKIEEFVIHLAGVENNWVLTCCSSGSSLRLPFSFEDVAKRIGSILKYEADGDSTKVLITEPQDTYKLAKLITRRVKEIQ